MPSPFPGMDPWLETPDLWPGVHATLIPLFRELLAPVLRPKYTVDVERRVYILDEDDPARLQIVPDLALLERDARARAPLAGAAPGAGTLLRMVLDTVEVRETRLLVRATEDKELVTVIELLSPANKTRGSRGLAEYREKRREVLRSKVNLVEIDLLRAGVRIPGLDALPRADYFAHVSRVEQRPRGEVFAWSLRDPAPTLPLPLRPADREPGLDLALALRLLYDRSGYDLLVDYRRPPEPPLGPEDAAWAAARIAEWRPPA
jgi:hypothetical protein